MLAIKKGDTWLIKPSIANFSCRTLYGSYPMSVKFSYCLIGSYPHGAPFARFQSIVQPWVPEDASAVLLAASPGMPVGFGWARYSSSVRPLAFIFCACSTPT